MLNLIGNPNETIDRPPIFLDFMNGVEILVNQYLKIGLGAKTESSNRYIPPTGNTILHIFGSWLFDAIHMNRNGFDEGTALATKTLVTMVSQKNQTEFLPIYSSNFFSCMKCALGADGRVLITAITSSTDLFTLEVRGSRCLVPFFIDAIYRICTGKATLADHVMPAEHVRRDSLIILAALISLPNQFNTTKFYLESKSNTYADLKPRIAAILIESLDCETNDSNIETILGLSLVWQLETICESSDFTKKCIKLILKKIKQGTWTPKVVLCSLRFLKDTASQYSQISKPSVAANSIVESLCKHIASIGNPSSVQSDELIAMVSFECISQWIMVNTQWILDYTDTINSLLGVIVVGLTGKQTDGSQQTEQSEPQASGKSKKNKDKKKEDKLQEKIPITIELSPLIKRASRRTLQTLLNLLGNFPPASGPTSFSTLATEEEILQDIVNKSNGEVSSEDTKHYIRYFVTDDNVVICVINRRYFDEDKPSVSVIVRDETGRYTWDTKLSYLPMIENQETEPIDRDEPIQQATDPYQFTSKKTLELNELDNVLKFFESKDKTTNSLKIVENQVKNEFKHLSKNSFYLDTNISTYKPNSPDMYAGNCKVNQARMFLSHLGFLSLENRDKLYPLTMNSSLFNLLRQLDQLQERTCIRVGILYVGKNQNEDDWFGNEGGNLDYQEFLTTLGWGIDLVKHNGFTGTLDVTGSMTGRVAPYWSDYNTEILFQVCTLMPNNSSYPDHAHKRKQSIHSHCVVVWLEDTSTFQPLLIWKRLRHSALIITITPLENGLYKINLYGKSPDLVIGPLVSGMVVRKEILGQMIRATAIHSWEIYENPDHTSPTQPRLDMIEKIYQSCKQLDNLEQFYTQQFTELPQDSVGPLQFSALKRSATKKNDKQLSPQPLKRVMVSDDDESSKKVKKKKYIIKRFYRLN